MMVLRDKLVPPVLRPRLTSLRLRRRMARSGSVCDMRQLTSALMEAREGTGEVRTVLLQAGFRPRLPGEARCARLRGCRRYQRAAGLIFGLVLA